MTNKNKIITLIQGFLIVIWFTSMLTMPPIVADKDKQLDGYISTNLAQIIICIISLAETIFLQSLKDGQKENFSVFDDMPICLIKMLCICISGAISMFVMFDQKFILSAILSFTALCLINNWIKEKISRW